MAGRPLRRLRNMLRLNPLVGWEDTSGMSPAKALEPYVALVKPGAEAKYGAVYTRVGLPIAVVLRPPSWSGRRTKAQRQGHAQENEALAKRLNAVLLVVSVPERYATPFYASETHKRGSSLRLSPYTPFVLLHRLGDEMNTLSGSYLVVPGKAPLCMQEPGDESLAEAGLLRGRLDAAFRAWWQHVGADEDEDPLLSRGVDTAAGRMGVLGADYMADLFAKWLLTGRVAYSAENPPPESREEQVFREMVAAYAPRILRIWYDFLQRSVPSVFDL